MNGNRRVCSAAVPCAVTAVFLFVALFLALSQASAAPYYKGKLIRIVVGYTPGGGFDTFGRLLARHIGRHVPGEPRVIVQNMPGASSMVAANRVYAMQPGDGRTIVTFHYGMVTQALVGDPNVRYDPLKFQWLGHPSLGGLPEVLYVRTDLNIRTLDDLRKRKEPLTMGATTVGTGAAAAGEFLRYVGLPVKNVYGYRGSAPTMAALERKEVDARFLSQANMENIYGRFLDEGIIRAVFAMGKDSRVKPLPGVATLEDLDLTTDQRKLADFMVTSWAMLRPFALPPGTPPDRLKILREAYEKAMKSPRLIKDAKRQGITIAPLSWQEVERIVKKQMQTAPEVVERYKKFIGLE